MILLELFSGIGGFHKGLSESGQEIKKCYFSEVDKHAIANYKHNFPNAQCLGSVTDVLKWRIERPNIITFGSPCQDFSLAGKRTGMDGDRSSLIKFAIMAIERFRPDIFIWENVKGAYSTNVGADYWGIIQAFTNIDGYRCETQLLNTAWFLPQNRERIYLVGHLAGRSEPGIFPFTEGDFRINEGESNTSVVRALTAGGHSGGHHSGMTLICDSGKSRKLEQREQMPPLRANTGAGHGNYVKYGNSQDQKISIDVSQTLNSGHYNVPKILDNSFKSRPERSYENIAPTLKENSYRNTSLNNVRRLTEIECERLQGYPDNWTEYGNYDGVVKKIAKTQRYKLCGNAVTVNVVKAIGGRLQGQNYMGEKINN